MIRVDTSTGKKYNENNVPLDKDRLTRCYTSTGKQYMIINRDSLYHTDESWYNGKFIGEYYAVFLVEGKTRYQVSKWYFRYGYAEKFMEKLMEQENVISEHFSGRVR